MGRAATLPAGRRGQLVETFLYASVVPAAIGFGILRAFFNRSDSLRDFGSFYASGQAAAEGLNPYAIYPLTYAVTTPTFCGYDQNLNPPTMLPVFEALSYLAPLTAFRVWMAISIASAVAMLAVLARAHRDQLDSRALLWFVALGAMWDTLYLGQAYIALALISACAWVLLNERRDIVAGVLIGILAAMKPNLLVWPVLLFLAGYRRSGIVSGITIIAMIAASLALYGPEVYAQWFNLLRIDGARAVLPINGSLIGFFSRLDAEIVGQTASALLLIACAAWAWIARPPVLIVSGVALAVSLLAAPLGWAHYSVFLVPIVFAHWKDRGPLATVCLWLLLVPPVFAGAAHLDEWWQLATWGSMYTVAFIGLAFLALTPQSVRAQ